MAATWVAADAALGQQSKTKGKTKKAPPAPPPEPVEAAPVDSLETIAFRRLAFGPRPSDLAAYRKLGMTDAARFGAFVEMQLHPLTIEDGACERRIAAARLETLTKSARQLWKDHWMPFERNRPGQRGGKGPSGAGAAAAADASGEPQTPQQEDMARRNENQIKTQPIRELEVATWLRVVYSKRQLFEVLVDFWHDHFNVLGWEPQISPVFIPYDRDVIRAHALGNFRELLGATARSPAMLYYLDNFINQSANANENYARELFELHTLGAENYLGTMDRADVPGYKEGNPSGYVDGDVYEAARALTGWRVDQGQNSGDTGDFQYFSQWHDRFQKIVLGKPLKENSPPMKDGEEVLDLVAFHPGTSRYVCRKLCRRLVSDEPPAALVESAARIFRDKRDDPNQIREVVRHIVLSKDFARTSRQKMRRPFEVTAAMLRALDADFFPNDPFLNNYARAGQRLFQWRTPDGFPDVRSRWGGTTPMLERWRLANMVCFGQFESVKADFMTLFPKPADQYSGEVLVDSLAEQLLGLPLAPAARAELVAFLDQAARKPGMTGPQPPAGGPARRIQIAAALILMSPEFQWK